MSVETGTFIPIDTVVDDEAELNDLTQTLEPGASAAGPQIDTPIMLAAPATPVFGEGNTGDMFKWICSADSVAEATRRVTVVRDNTSSQNFRDYLNREILNNFPYLLEVYRAWQFTAGLSSSTMIENLQHTFKAELRGSSVPLHDLPDYLLESVTKRNMKSDYKASVNKTLKALATQGQQSGSASLVLALGYLGSPPHFRFKVEALVPKAKVNARFRAEHFAHGANAAHVLIGDDDEALGGTEEVAQDLLDKEGLVLKVDVRLLVQHRRRNHVRPVCHVKRRHRRHLFHARTLVANKRHVHQKNTNGAAVQRDMLVQWVRPGHCCDVVCTSGAGCGDPANRRRPCC